MSAVGASRLLDVAPRCPPGRTVRCRKAAPPGERLELVCDKEPECLEFTDSNHAMRTLHPWTPDVTDPSPPLSTTSLAPAAFGSQSIEVLNSECFCISLDNAALRRALESEIGQPGLFDLIQQRCPYLFATRPVFLSRAHMTRMAQVVQAIDSVVALPAYREEVLASAPASARHDHGGAKGVFFGYDFHVAEGSFGLIEINTNAGGAMLNAVLARAQRACCAAVDALLPLPATASEFEDSIVSMFRSEWSLGGHERPLRSIAIVDENPE